MCYSNNAMVYYSIHSLRQFIITLHAQPAFVTYPPATHLELTYQFVYWVLINNSIVLDLLSSVSIPKNVKSLSFSNFGIPQLTKTQYVCMYIY